MATTYTRGWVDTNGAPGYASIPGKGQSIWEESSTQNMTLGKKTELSDGRVFRYGYFYAATGIALLAGPDASEVDVVETDNAIVASASSQTTTDGTAGQKFIEITLASVSANQYAGGYLHLTDGTGVGRTYRIRRNTATNTPATGNIRVELFDDLAAAVDASTDFAITGHRFMSLRGATAATDPLVSGVTVRGMTADYYGFVQTWGPATVLADGAGISKGDEVSLSDGVTGAFQLQDAWTEQRVGVALFAPDDTTYGGVFLQIMP